jgi:hypothetical protein
MLYSFEPFSANVMFSFPSFIASWLFERHERGSERGVPIISYIVIYKRAKQSDDSKKSNRNKKKKRGVVASTKTGNARENLGALWLGSGKIKWIRQNGMG